MILVWDTSAIIDAWRDYPIDVFPSLWERIARSVDDDESLLLRDVFDELGVGEDSLLAWCKANWQTRIELEEDVQESLSLVMDECPTINKTTGLKDAADLNQPLILATANDMSEDSEEVREELLFA